MNRFEDYGIKGINQHGASEQRTHCPQCPTIKPYEHQNSFRDKDLAVNVSKGTWHCHRCGWSGGLQKEKKEFTRPTFQKIESKSQPLADKNMDFFTTRGIPKEVVDRNKITKDKVFIVKHGKVSPVICFNYFVGDDLVNVKCRTVDKQFTQAKGGAKVFYKLNDIEGESTVIITEGEMDALSYEVAGYKNAISVPEGGLGPDEKPVSKMKFLDNCAEYFENVTKIYLALDADTKGFGMRDELARRLGRHRCYIVHYPEGCKDANEVLLKHGKTELVNSITTAEPYPIEGEVRVKDLKDEMAYLHKHGYPNGARTGWTEFDDHLKFHDSVLTVITGIPSHGKSNFLDNLMLRLAVKNGWKFGIFSPENGKTEIHLQRLCEILVGKPLLPTYNNQMTAIEMNDAMNWLDEHVYFIRPENEDFSLHNILELTTYYVRKYGIKGLIIDPWNTVEHEFKGESETEYTKKVLNQLTYFERTHGLHLFLVAHPTKIKKRKDGDKYDIPTLYDIAGSANWYNKAELGITVYREFSSDFKTTKHTAVFIQKVKHRFMGHTGMVKFQFDQTCQRYNEEKDFFQGSMLQLELDNPDYFEDTVYEDPEF